MWDVSWYLVLGLMDEHQEILGDSYIFLAVDISKETQYLQHTERKVFLYMPGKTQLVSRKTIKKLYND